jgi:hypothetical protein
MCRPKAGAMETTSMDVEIIMRITRAMGTIGIVITTMTTGEMMPERMMVVMISMETRATMIRSFIILHGINISDTLTIAILIAM